LVTVTVTAPAACAGAVAVIDVLFTTVTPVAAVPPKLTVAPERKPVPAIVTAVPPLALPVLGVIEVTVGPGAVPEVTIWTNVATEGTPLLFTRNNM
jgi:hypothetical protein